MTIAGRRWRTASTASVLLGATGGVPFVLKDARDQCADVAFVVDDENVVAHNFSD
jgi:hypothetical protein